MLDQVKILNTSEDMVCVLSNTLDGACPVIDIRTTRESFSGGSYSDMCTLTIPANHTDSQYVTGGNYILFADSDNLWQEYRIVDVQREDRDTGSLLVATAEHAFYELLGEPIDDSRPTETTASAAVIAALNGTRWTIGTADSLGDNSTRIYKTSVLAALAQIAEVWGGELQFRITVGGGVISGRYVDILSARGTNRGKRFEFNKDIKGIVQTVNRQNLATALIGRGKGVEVEGGTDTDDPTYGRRLEFDEIEWTTGGGDPANKPLGNNYIGDATAQAAYGPGGRHIYDYVIFEECTDAEELLELTYAELQVRKVPQVTYEMDVITLEEISGLEHEAVRLGDTVAVINTAVTPTISGTARVTRIDRSYIDPTDTYVTVGNYLPKLSTDTVSTQETVLSMTERMGIWDRSNAFEPDETGAGTLDYKLDLLRTQLSSSVSGVSTDENGNLIIENATQTKALKLGAGIFAIANTKSGGEYVWRTFGDGDGFTADEITAGTMTAAIVFAGVLTGATGTFEQLTAGVTDAQRLVLGTTAANEPYIRVYDNTNTLKITITKNGIIFGTTTTFLAYTIGDRSGVGIFI